MPELCLIFDTTAGSPQERPVVRQLIGAGYDIVDSGSNGDSQLDSPPGGVFSEAGQNFNSTVQVGDRLRIKSGDDIGIYDIESVDSDTQLTTDGEFAGSSGVDWQIERSRDNLPEVECDAAVTDAETQDGKNPGDYDCLIWGMASVLLKDLNDFAIDTTGSPPKQLIKKSSAESDPNEI